MKKSKSVRVLGLESFNFPSLGAQRFVLHIQHACVTQTKLPFLWRLLDKNLTNHHRILLSNTKASRFHNLAAALHLNVLDAINLPSILANNAPWAAPVAQEIHGRLVPMTAKFFPKLLAQACKVH